MGGNVGKIKGGLCMNPLVSLVIAVHDRREYIDKAIESFEIQNGEHELIVVDDCSNLPYTEKMKPYIIRTPQNLGTPASFNFGFRQARGQYLALLGDDDLLIGEDSLNVRAAVLNFGADMVYTDALEIDAAGEIMKRYDRGEVSREMIWKGDCINVHTMMWRKEICERIGYQDERLKWDDDWEWKIRLINEVRCLYLPEITAATRYHASCKSLGTNRHLVEKDHELTRQKHAWRYR
jgi:glycosyltransferase involved in cell wall biosynthesis